MRFTSPMKDRVKMVLPVIALLAVIAGITLPYLWSNHVQRENEVGEETTPTNLLASPTGALFTERYPASDQFEKELQALRSQGKLRPSDEILIQRSVLAASEKLKIPTALLWCLFFQESRLNHRLGIENSSGALGLGQFIYFSFFEINHHIDQYTNQNLEMMVSLLGKDVRPVEPRPETPDHPSSYYSIPTAVASSTAYLNNRYLQLAGLLTQQSIPYDPDILWLYSAMAYNKGTRAVLSFWNEQRRRGGKERVALLTSDREAAFQALRDSVVFTEALRNIWPMYEAAEYAKELTIHMQNIQECSLYRRAEENSSKKGKEF